MSRERVLEATGSSEKTEPKLTPHPQPQHTHTQLPTPSCHCMEMLQASYLAQALREAPEPVAPPPLGGAVWLP